MDRFLENNFTHESKFEGRWNHENITLHRYTKGKDIGLKGEHISFVYDEKSRMLGLTRMLEKFEKKDNFSLSKEDAVKFATQFLKLQAPKLLDKYKLLWVDMHDETIIKNGRKIIISGLKVKCQNLDDKKYFWLIVANDGQIITFERDVIWNFLKQSRTTEKWLHDSFLEQNLKAKI